MENTGPTKAIEIYFNYKSDIFRHICIEIYKTKKSNVSILYDSLNHKKKLVSFSYIFKSFFFVKSINPDIIHAHLPQANILSRIIKVFFPKKKIINTYRISEQQNNEFGIYSLIYRSLFMMTNFLVDIHIAISSRIYNELSKTYFINTKKIKYVKNASDYIIEEKTNYDRKEKGFLSFIAIGSLTKRKNYIKLIELFKKEQKLKLYIYGEGPEKKNISDYILKNNLNKNIYLMGFNKKITSKIKEFDAFILLSKGEGISRAMLESMQVGLPLLCSDVSGVEECVLPLENGFILKNNIGKIFKNSIKILSKKSSREKMGLKSKLIYKNHQPEEHIRIMDSLYKELIKKNKL